MKELLIEPLKYYESQGREEHAQNCSDYYDLLLEKSGVNVEENRNTVQKYNAAQDKIAAVDKEIRKFKLIKALLITAIIVGAIFIILACVNFYNGDDGLWQLLLGLVLIVVSVIILIKTINPKIKNANELREKHLAEAHELYNLAKSQVAPLNALFDGADSFRMIEKTVPLFNFDVRFDSSRLRSMVNNYDFIDLQEENSSVLDMISGEFSGNPFLYCRRRIQEMGTHTYHGSLVIHWTETYRDNEGNLATRSRSETLYASVTKPKPYYYTNTYLGYGNQAAPELSFTREATDTEELSERALARKVRKGERKLKKMAEKTLKNGGTFQQMTNSEFDVLYGATDRNHEVQFRVMFTPLAQRSTIDLLKDKKNYGDDFNFSKFGKYNIVCSEHSQNWNMNTSPSNYFSHDVDEIKKKFVSFNSEFFKSIFFDFAPILAIPVYMDEPGISVADDEGGPIPYPYYSHEMMANALGQESFAHPCSATEAILKTSYLSTAGVIDRVQVKAYSFEIIPRIDYVSVRGGDGDIHAVPVHWDEYIPVSDSRMMEVEAADIPWTKDNDSLASRTYNVPDGKLFRGFVSRHI